MRNNVDLPLPLAPIRAILSPFSISPSVFFNNCKPGYSLEISRNCTTLRPDGRENEKRNDTEGLSSSTSETRSIFSKALIRDCAILALEAFARKRSIKRSSSLIFCCWFLN
ncbi:hypothetical protein D3C72_1519800 [compost metagenome]